MARVKIKQVDSFTRVPHTGNPAGVVLEGKELTERQMQSIAREMNVSETAFLLPPTRQGADMRIRWFTPTMEVPICGHATVAAFHSLAEEERAGMVKAGKYEFALETASGVLPVSVEKEEGKISVMMGLKLHPTERTPQLKVDLVRLLNISPAEFESRIAITRSDYLLVPIKRLHTLFTMKPNLMNMIHFLSSRNLGGLCVFTTETIDRESVVHSRFFAPHRGINEDPVTGSAHGPLAVALYENGMLELKDGRCVFQGEQGDAIGRRGRVTVELNVDDNKPVSVKIGGSAVTVMEGDMVVDD
ncbi:MAG TPA: PhzF family phenazine biosynthesis protein [Bacteroidota bacterium]|jgi:PhzF family phenazine biosynthesis protein|nr:PhzF family phenazine biosynthesis protein [Bacteroidota bacterium]